MNQVNKIIKFCLDIFRFHKTKIAFLLASITVGILLKFPYDDLSDFITLKITQMTQSNVYVQFDGLGFALLPQLGIQMDDVVIESVFAPSIAVKSLGVAPKFAALLGKPAAKIVADGVFKGEAVVNVSPSNELDIDTQEMGIGVELEDITLKELSKYLKKTMQFPVTMNGSTGLVSQLYVDPSFKKQPKGSVDLRIKDLDIPSSNIPIKMGPATMSMAMPGLKLSELVVVGNINDGKLFIKEGKIGDPKNDLHGQVTGDLFFEIKRGGKFQMAGYDLKINLNISENLKRQLATILGFIDIYKGIGDKYKFDSLRGVRYSMRLTARSMTAPPRVSSY